jgi:hypothetical protein
VARRPAALVLLLLLFVSGSGASAGRDTRQVPRPPADASPQRVVAAYVAALDAHDLRTARALMTPRFREDVGRQVDSWFSNVVTMRRLRIGRPLRDRHLASARRHRFVLYLGVEFDLQQGRELSMRNGPAVWGYVLVRDRPGARWLVDEDGVF